MIVNSGLFGGPGGTPFNESSRAIAGIGRIKIHHGQFVDRLEATYALRDGERLSRAYGGRKPPGTARSSLPMTNGLVELQFAEYVASLAFITYRMFGLAGMRRYGPFGGPGGQNCTVLSPDIREFFGRAGSVLDAIGFRCEEPMLVC